MKFRVSCAVIAIAVSAFAAAGCAKKNDTPEAVKEGVVRDLAKSFDMGTMDVNVDSVSFRDNEADATVTFSPKGGTRDQGMTMNYVMERRKDNLWYIKSRKSAPPPAAAPGPDSGAGEMPAGHPGKGGGGSELPPGHPSTGQTQ